MIKPTRHSDLLAEVVVERVSRLSPPDKAVVLVFSPTDPPDQSALFSTAGAADLIPVLRSVLQRLESGALRMPVEAEVRWVDVPEEERR
jgi:hypothetical protein